MEIWLGVFHRLLFWVSYLCLYEENRSRMILCWFAYRNFLLFPCYFLLRINKCGFNQLLLPNSLLDNGWPVDGFCLLVFWDPLVEMRSPRGFFLDATLSCIDHRPSARQWQPYQTAKEMRHRLFSLRFFREGLHQSHAPRSKWGRYLKSQRQCCWLSSLKDRAFWCFHCSKKSVRRGCNRSNETAPAYVLNDLEAGMASLTDRVFLNRPTS